MDCIIIYVSKHKGNTKKIALEMSDEIKCKAKALEEVNIDDIEKSNYLGIGSGIYAFGMDRRLKKLLKNLKNKSGKKAFLFSTSGDLNGLKYHRSMKKFLEKNGIEVIGEFNCPGAFTGWFFGRKSINLDRPNELDLKKAREFVRALFK